MVKLAGNLLQQKNGQDSSKFAAVKMVNFLLPIFQVSSKNGKLFVADSAVSASVNDANHRKPNSFITPMIRDMGRNMLPAVKNGKLFVADFSDFYLAASASVNGANHRKQNSFITPMSRHMGRNMLPAVKTENFLSPIFIVLYAHP